MRSLLVAGGRAVSAPAVVIAAVAFAAGGVMLCDRRLTRAVDQRRERVVAEFPTFVDLVCLAVTAGESLRGALELVAAGSGALATRSVAPSRKRAPGRPLAEALDARARRLAVAPLERFVEAVVDRAGTGHAARRLAPRDGVRCPRDGEAHR